MVEGPDGSASSGCYSRQPERVIEGSGDYWGQAARRPPSRARTGVPNRVRLQSIYGIETSSTSKTSVAFGGMTPPAPVAP